MGIVAAVETSRISPQQKLIHSILRKQAQVGVIGLGYVGLRLCLLFAQGGFRTTGLAVYDHEFVMKESSLVVNTRNATSSVREGREKVVQC